MKNLKGVVVLEDIEKFVTKLQSSKVSREEKLKILNKLRVKQPSTEIIIKSGIGKVVKNLMKTSEDEQIAKAARNVKTCWQNLIERRVELKTDKKEVQTDLQTRNTREKAVKLLTEKYEEKIDREFLISFEKALYNNFKPVIGDKYRRAVRRVVTQPSIFEDLLLEGSIEKVIKKASH